MFTTTLITIAREWKQPKYPSTEELIQKIWFFYTMEYYSARKKIIPQQSIIIKYNKSDIERQISYDITDVWNLKKKVQMNLFTKQKLNHKCRRQTYGFQVWGRITWEIETDRYTLLHYV